MPFRLEHITLEQRVALSSLCLLEAGRYGLITELARAYGTSRQFWYDLRERAQGALEQELAPRPAGRRAPVQTLVVDRPAAERAVLVLHQVAHASVRGIREALAELLGVCRSEGWVQGVLNQAAQRARTLQPVPTGPLRALADETYAGRRPVLAVVDHPSGLIAALEPAETASETAWGCVLLDLASRGVAIGELTADGAPGLAAGARAAGLGQPRLDHWHVLHALWRVAKRLEGQAYRALAAAERAERAAAEATQAAERGRRRVGRPLAAPADAASVAAAQRTAAAAIERADGVRLVLGWVAQTLWPVQPRTGRVRTADEVVSELTAAAALLGELGGRAAEVAGLLERAAPGLAAYLLSVENALAGPRAVLPEATVTFLAWAWCHRDALGLSAAAEAWPEDPAAAGWVWTALAGAARGTGMVEQLNSVLAFPRATRRGLPNTTLALVAVYRNHHRFARGRRAGHTPLELAGLPSPHWLDALGYRPPPQPLNFRQNRAQTVNSLAA